MNDKVIKEIQEHLERLNNMFSKISSARYNRLISPIGTISYYEDFYISGITEPLLEAEGLVVCDGRSLSKSDFPELYAMIGAKYGEDEATFKLPQLCSISSMMDFYSPPSLCLIKAR